MQEFREIILLVSVSIGTWTARERHPVKSKRILVGGENEYPDYFESICETGKLSINRKRAKDRLEVKRNVAIVRIPME